MFYLKFVLMPVKLYSKIVLGKYYEENMVKIRWGKTPRSHSQKGHEMS